jgi:hypothetical protein
MRFKEQRQRTKKHDQAIRVLLKALETITKKNPNWKKGVKS